MIQQETNTVQASYDRIAEEYARRMYDELAHKPLDRELLDRFAERVRGKGNVCDLGCGPGHVTQYLNQRGVPVCGLDLSPAMIECARRLNPGITFSVGDMLELDVGDEEWAGIAAFYAIVNIPPADLERALQEMQRVLQPRGRLLLSFHIGDEVAHLDDLWGHAVSLDFYFFRTERISGLLQSAGFEIDEIIEREPYAPDVEYQSRRACIFARKPGTTTTSA